MVQSGTCKQPSSFEERNKSEAPHCWNNYVTRQKKRLYSKSSFGIARSLAVPDLLQTSFVARFVEGIFSPKKRIVPYNFKPVPILVIKYIQKEHQDQDKKTTCNDHKRECPMPGIRDAVNEDPAKVGRFR